jgi:hypothetical protein
MADILSHIATLFSGVTLVFAIVPLLIRVFAAWTHEVRNVKRAIISIKTATGEVKFDVNAEDPDSVARLLGELQKAKSVPTTPSASPESS